jgi:hypothetical protein
MPYNPLVLRRAAAFDSGIDNQRAVILKVEQSSHKQYYSLSFISARL